MILSTWWCTSRPRPGTCSDGDGASCGKPVSEAWQGNILRPWYKRSFVWSGMISKIECKYLFKNWEMTQTSKKTSTMVNIQSDAMSMVHFSTAMRYRLFLEKLNIAIVAMIFLDHRDWLFFDYFAHFRTDYFGIIHNLISSLFKAYFMSLYALFRAY